MITMNSVRNTVRKRILAGGAAAVLSLGVVSCSEAEDAATEAESVISDVTGENGADDGGASSDPSAEPTDDGADETGAAENGEETGETGADETTEVEAADGSMIEIPAAVASLAESGDFGAPESVEDGPNGESLVTYADGRHIVHSEESGAQPLVGMIGETWVSEGGFDAPVGLPTAAEVANEDGNGWTQEFTQGSIAWTADDSGEYSADVQAN